MHTIQRMRNLPAEWMPQSGVMLTWPHPNSGWQASLSSVESVFRQLAMHISRFENVLITCQNPDHLTQVRAFLNEEPACQMSRMILSCAPSNDSWARDHGPIGMIENQHIVLLDFTFNGWGNKYPAALDNRITQHLHEQQVFGQTTLLPVDFVLEGGSIDCDGEGSLLTTSRCLTAGTRNPDCSPADIEQILRQHLGISRVLWLHHGLLEGDDTDSHIDMLARFCNVTTIAYSQCLDPQDSHWHELQLMEQELRALRTLNGEAYRLVGLPLPQPIVDQHGQRLPASYANFLIINEAVLVPLYDDPADAVALQRLQTCFPDRQVIGINSRPLIEQYGSLHCVSMQLPAGLQLQEPR